VAKGKRTWRSWPWVVLAAGLIAGAGLLGSTTAGAATGNRYVVVKHVLFATEGGGVALEESVSAQFVVNNHTWATSSLPVQVRYNGANAPAGHDVPGLIQQAVATWNGAGSAFSFAWAGASTGTTGACDAQIDVDGVNTIAFVNLNGPTLGQTCTIFPVGANTKLVEFDMELDVDADWGSISPVPGNLYDLHTTILHELGHAAGLGHSADVDALMYFQIGRGDDKRVLRTDDLNGIRAAYPPSVTPQTTAPATSTPAPGSPTPTPFPPTLTPPPQGDFKVRTLQLARD
jgi:hypothetical protein